MFTCMVRVGLHHSVIVSFKAIQFQESVTSSYYVQFKWLQVPNFVSKQWLKCIQKYKCICDVAFNTSKRKEEEALAKTPITSSCVAFPHKT